MYSNIYRFKLLNALLFFARNLKHPNLTMICKLLWYLDSEHFKQTGYPSIGLQYFAFKNGPVPEYFWQQIKDGDVPEDFRGKLGIEVLKDEFDDKYKELRFKAKIQPDLSIFSPREMEILNRLVTIYKYERAVTISRISHEKEEPWDITIREKGLKAPIDYMLAIDENAQVDVEFAKVSLQEHFEIIKNFNLSPI